MRSDGRRPAPADEHCLPQWPGVPLPHVSVQIAVSGSAATDQTSTTESDDAMSEPIVAGFKLKAIRFKLVGEQGNEQRVAEIVFLTEDLRAASDLLWSLGHRVH